MLVSTNLSSLSAQRMLFENTKAASTAMERLATGSKINKAQDDVAGSAIADRMTSQVRGLHMAVKNVNDAMAMLSVADSAASDITDMLQRMRELAIQAASDTNSAADHQYLQGEVTGMTDEIARIIDGTAFNNSRVFDDGYIGDNSRRSWTGGYRWRDDLLVEVPAKEVSIQIGANAGDTLDLGFNPVLHGFDRNMSHFGAMAETATVRGLKTPNDLNYWGYNFSTAVANGGFTAAHLKNFLTVDVDNSGNPVTVDLSALAANDRMYFGAEIAQAIEDDANAKFANQGELGIDVTYDSLNQKFAISSLTIDNSSAIEVNFSVPVFDANGVPTGVVDAQGNKLLFHNLRSAPFMGFEVTGSYNSKYSGSIDAAINIIDTALEELTAQRAEYGAMQNRLQYTISNLMNVSEQTTAARSRIEDADFATESAVLAKSQVLQQSGAAMLAQANARPQLVLQLIK